MRLRGILEFFGLRRGDRPRRSKPAATSAATKTPATAPFDPEAFRQGLAAIVKESGAAATGQIQFLGLDGIRNQLGERWDRLESRIHTVTRKTIEAHISAADLYTPYDETTYLLAFSGGNKDEAALKIALILKSINEALFGEEGVEAIQIHSVVSVVDQELVLEAKSLQDCLDRVASNAAHSGTLIPAPAAAQETASTQSQPAAATAKAAQSAPVAVAAPPSPRPAAAAPVQSAAVPRTARAMAPAAPAAVSVDPEAQSVPTPSLDASAAGLSFVYAPIWHAKQEAISAYHCIPKKDTPSGTVYGFSAIYGIRPKGQPVERDIKALRHSIELFTELAANSFEYIAVHSVHYDTLTNPMLRRAYLASCHCIPPELAPYQTIEIFGAPATVPTSRYTEIIAALKPFFKKTCLRTSLRGEHLAGAGEAGFDGFSLLVQDDPATIDEKLPLLVQTGRKIQKLGAYSYAFDIRSKQTMLFAADAGFNWIGSHYVMKPVEFPSHVERYPRSNFEAG